MEMINTYRPNYMHIYYTLKHTVTLAVQNTLEIYWWHCDIVCTILRIVDSCATLLGSKSSNNVSVEPMGFPSGVASHRIN